MSPQQPSAIAVYPGVFDPVTYGHLDVMRRGADVFSELIVGVGDNPEKAPWFTAEERIEMLRPHIEALPNARVQSYTGLTIDFVLACDSHIILRGIRDQVDLSSELQQANINQVVGGIETVFLATTDEHALTSSTYIKQIFELGGHNIERIRRLVPPNVIDRLVARMQRTAE
jgi:pantetheine-phosphate adenylyltransferase